MDKTVTKTTNWMKHQLVGGAQLERTAWRKFINSQKKKGAEFISIDDLIAFCEKRKKLYNQRIGGLGRK